METRIYTLHRHPRSGEIEAVGEPGWLAGIPPLWALWEGLWIWLAVQLVLLAGVAVLAPVAFGTTVLAIVLLSVFEGTAIQRLELRLRGWREIALAEAATPEGAEELLVTGQAVRTAEDPAP